MATARLTLKKQALFETFGSYRSAISILNDLPPQHGFIWREYSPASGAHGHERKYFTETNAGKIDAIRQEIASWRTTGSISEREEALLLGDLLLAASRVANIAGTYGAFLREWLPTAVRPLEMAPRALRAVGLDFDTQNVDIRNLHATELDTVYLDPPYTKRQYAAYYHVLETIAIGDSPVVHGVTGLRPWREKSSDFCFKSRALRALTEVLQQLNCRRILLSYSAEGHIDLGSLFQTLSGFGSVEAWEIGRVGRYRPNAAASTAGESVAEFLFDLRPEHQNAVVV